MWCNGHEWAKRQAVREGVEFTARANGFASCAHPEALQAICDSFGPADVARLTVASSASSSTIRRRAALSSAASDVDVPACSPPVDPVLAHPAEHGALRHVDGRRDVCTERPERTCSTTMARNCTG